MRCSKCGDEIVSDFSPAWDAMNGGIVCDPCVSLQRESRARVAAFMDGPVMAEVDNRETW